MSVRFKIIGLTLLVFVIGLILGITGIICSARLTSMADEQYVLSGKSHGVSAVLNAHYTWKQTLTEAVLYGEPFTGSLDPSTCALGKWKDSDAAQGITDPEILDSLSKLDAPHDYIHNEAATIVALIADGNQEEAERVLRENILPKANDAITILGDMESRYAQLLAEEGAAIVQVGDTMKLILIILIAVAFLVGLLLTWRVTSSIMVPLRNMARAGEAVAIGDLDVDVRHHVDDEIGKLADAFNKIINATKEQVTLTGALAAGDLTVSIAPRSEKDAMNIELNTMLDRLNDMFGGINASAAQVAVGSRQISDGAQSLAQSSTQQAAAVQQLSASIADISDKTKDNASMARRAAELADIIKRNAEKGSTQMDEMMSAVQDINTASQSINKVIKVIDDIAFQTNILALNAAVEAARAGQHGKGFAVVAEEVRNLAAKSAEAAKDTEALIANSMEKAAFGSQIAAETATSLNDIVTGINESGVLVNDIAMLSDAQAAGIVQINKGIDQVAQVVQQNSATAEQSAAASEEMSGQSLMLEDMISKFKIKNTLPEYARPRQGLPPSPHGAPQDTSFGKY